MTQFAKVFLVVVLIACVLVGALVIFSSCGAREEEDYSDAIRIHIRANSNTENDQSVKLKVRDGVVEYLTPMLANCQSRAQAYSTIAANLDETEQVANSVLAEYGYDYVANVKLTKENFPTRKYLGITFEGGEYDALIVELGSGTGDNWWCVAFPPLCFVPESDGDGDGEGDVELKSKVAELVDKYFNRGAFQTNRFTA